jgi:hypothetical protein
MIHMKRLPLYLTLLILGAALALSVSLPEGKEAATHGVPRSTKWPAVEKEHLKREPACVVCGHKGKGLNVHHILSFRLHPELELDDGKDGSGTDGNLITLCGEEGRCKAHYWLGHCGEWSGWNPHVREDAKLMKQRWQESANLAKKKTK